MRFSAVRAVLLVASTCAFVSVSACVRGAASAPVSGAVLYEACVTCHGAAGEGTPALGAPRIGGLPTWYVASQIKRFQAGFRGKHPDDVEGMRMRAMARQMMTPAEVDTVAAYVAGLAPAASAATLRSANPDAAAVAFQVCAACHGQKGEGNEALNAPRLAGLDDWYLARQIRKFQAGVRGWAPDDMLGPQMLAMSRTIQPEQVDDIAVFLHNLK